jgi:4-amino-4-deoxy-L-arabinose transferase-like glycosyltransferase
MVLPPFLTGRGPADAARRILLVGLAAAMMGLAGVFTLPPLDRDEARFAQASAQMLETGDFIVIRFQDDERNKKPAGAYWLQAASVAAFSAASEREIWAYRLPSVLGAVLAAVFTYGVVARLFDPAVGVVTALFLATAPVFAAEATIAKTDAPLLASVAGAAMALAHLLSAARSGAERSLAAAIGFWIAVGAGVLIKGPIILLVIAPMLLLIGLRFPETRPLRALRPATGALILALMIGPWAYAIGVGTEGRFFSEAIGADMMAKIGAPQESHAGPPGYHLLLSPLLAFPFAALIPAGLTLAFRLRTDFSVLFLLAWLVPGWLIFEVAATKLPHYALPMYPALAALAALAAFRPDAAPRGAWRAGAVIFAAAGLTLAAAMAALPLLVGAKVTGAGVAAAIVVGALTLAAALRFWRAEALKGAALSIPAAAILAVTLLAGVLPGLSPLALSSRLSAALEDADLHPLRHGAAPAALAGYYEPSAVFLLGTATRLGNGGDAADALIDDAAVAVVETRERGAFDARLTSRGVGAAPVAVIDGFNYSKGERVRLSVFRRADEGTSR